MNSDPPLDELILPMGIVPQLDLLPGVFAFLDTSLPEALKGAAIRNDPGVGRLPEIPLNTSWRQSRLYYKAKPPTSDFFIGYVVEGFERQTIAKVLNATFRLQWKGCPLRSFLAEYRLYHRDDMADALASAYIQHKRGGDPEAALSADYSVSVRGLLYHEEIDKFRNAQNDGYLDSFWRQFRPFYEEGDRIVIHVSIPYDYYLLVRADRLVWQVESIHKCVVGVSLKQRAEEAHFEALGGCKGFLNGDFIWPPLDWINPVSDEEERISLGKSPLRG